MVTHRNPKEQKEEISKTKLIDFDYEKTGDGVYEVQGNDIVPYHVNLINHTCTCKGWYYGNNLTKDNLKTCKHIENMKEVREIEKN